MTYEIPYAAAYHETVSKCDIYDDVGLTAKSVPVTGAWLDGEEIDLTTATERARVMDHTAWIVNTDTTNKVGAQGRITEVYAFTNGLDEWVKLVEINVYLAQVTKVTAEKTDKNDHVEPAYITASVYVDEGQDVTDKGAVILTGKTYVTDDPYDVGDYALVTVNKVETYDKTLKADVWVYDEVQSAELTTPVAYGEMTDYTTTTTMEETKYTDADKFVRVDDEYIKGATSGNSATNASYFSKEAAWNVDRSVLVDDWGNIIGLVKEVPTLMVINRIEWKHSTTEIGEGYALADITLKDGTVLKGQKVSYIADTSSVFNAATNKTDGDTVSIATAQLSDDYQNNVGAYSNHIFSYTVMADESLRIKHVALIPVVI